MNYLALGDSYTIGEAVNTENSFPLLLANKINAVSQVIAKTGWTTSDLLLAIDGTKTLPNYDFVSLLIGVNNQYQGKSREFYEKDLSSLFKFISSKKPKKIICISIPNYGYTPFGREQLNYISGELGWYNKTLKSFCEKHQGVWVDIEQISMNCLKNPDLLAQDKLHPSGEMYKQIVNKIINEIT